MRKLGKHILLHEDEYFLYLQVIEDLQSMTDNLECLAEPNQERDRELLRLKIREEGIAEKLKKAPNLSPNNWDLIYKPWLENLREYFTSDTKIT